MEQNQNPTNLLEEKYTFRREVSNYLQERGVIFACILIDCLFVSLWVIGIWLTENYIVTPLALKGVDKLALSIFQWFSGVSTLLTLIAYVVRDHDKL